MIFDYQIVLDQVRTLGNKHAWVSDILVVGSVARNEQAFDRLGRPLSDIDLIVLVKKYHFFIDTTQFKNDLETLEKALNSDSTFFHISAKITSEMLFLQRMKINNSLGNYELVHNAISLYTNKRLPIQWRSDVSNISFYQLALLIPVRLANQLNIELTSKNDEDITNAAARNLLDTLSILTPLYGEIYLTYRDRLKFIPIHKKSTVVTDIYHKAYCHRFSDKPMTLEEGRKLLLQSFKALTSLYIDYDKLFRADSAFMQLFMFRTRIRIVKFLVYNRKRKINFLHALKILTFSEKDILSLLLLSLEAYYSGKATIKLPKDLSEKVVVHLGEGIVTTQQVLRFSCALTLFMRNGALPEHLK